MSFTDDAIAFVPDADDLLELIDNQIGAHGIDPSKKSITVTYTPKDQWRVTIEYGDATTVVVGQESIHSALAMAFYQMGVPASGPAAE